MHDTSEFAFNNCAPFETGALVVVCLVSSAVDRSSINEEDEIFWKPVIARKPVSRSRQANTTYLICAMTTEYYGTYGHANCGPFI